MTIICSFFFILFTTSVVFTSSSDAAKLNIDDANQLFQELSTNQSDKKCYEKNLFQSCVDIWNSKEGKNLHTLKQLHKITQNNPILHDLEVLWEFNDFLGDNSIKQDTLNLLQKTYRNEADIKGNADYFLKSYKVNNNDLDIENFITKSSNPNFS